jgi:hypothetical protein
MTLVNRNTNRDLLDSLPQTVRVRKATKTRKELTQSTFVPSEYQVRLAARKIEELLLKEGGSYTIDPRSGDVCEQLVCLMAHPKDSLGRNLGERKVSARLGLKQLTSQGNVNISESDSGQEYLALGYSRLIELRYQREERENTKDTYRRQRRQAAA